MRLDPRHAARALAHVAWRQLARTRFQRELPGFGQMEVFVQRWLLSDGKTRSDLLEFFAQDVTAIKAFRRAGGLQAGFAMVVGSNEMPAQAVPFWSQPSNDPTAPDEVRTVSEAVASLILIANIRGLLPNDIKR